MLRVTTYCFKVLHCISVCMVKSIRSGFLSLLNHRTLYLTVHGKLEVFFCILLFVHFHFCHH